MPTEADMREREEIIIPTFRSWHVFIRNKTVRGEHERGREVPIGHGPLTVTDAQFATHSSLPRAAPVVWNRGFFGVVDGPICSRTR